MHAPIAHYNVIAGCLISVASVSTYTQLLNTHPRVVTQHTVFYILHIILLCIVHRSSTSIAALFERFLDIISYITTGEKNTCVCDTGILICIMYVSIILHATLFVIVKYIRATRSRLYIIQIRIYIDLLYV